VSVRLRHQYATDNATVKLHLPHCVLPPLPPQALEAIKLLSGVGEPLSRRLLAIDCAAGRFHSVKLRAK